MFNVNDIVGSNGPQSLPNGHVCSMLECSTSWSIGHHMGIHCNVACASIEIQIICNLF